jgi:hypothetical protein
MNLEHIKTFGANAYHAARNQQTVHIGGGDFNAEELLSVSIALKDYESTQKTLQEISEILREHPDFQKENSSIRFCANKVLEACRINLTAPENQVKPRPRLSE